MDIKKILLSIWTKQEPSSNTKDYDGKTVSDLEKTVQLKSLKPLESGVLRQYQELKTDGKEKSLDIGVNHGIKPYNYRQFKGNIKRVPNKHTRLKILFYYLKENTKNGVFKKSSNKIIGEYFDCKQDLIRELFNELKRLNYVVSLNEIELTKELKDIKDYYKINKEWED